MLHGFRVIQGCLQTGNISVQMLSVPKKFNQRRREKEKFCLKNFSSKKWAYICSVEINISYSQKEIAKRVQNNINQNVADIEESRPDPQLTTFMYILYIYIYIWKRNMKPFSNETLNVFVRKFCFSYILDLAKTVWALRVLSQKFTRNFLTKEFWVLQNYVLVNMLLCSSHFTEVH